MTAQIDRRLGRQSERGEPARRNLDRSSSVVSRRAGADPGHDALSVDRRRPRRATQLAVLLSFTPSGTAGADDSISINGVQLEIGARASPFERIDAQVVLETLPALRLGDPGAGGRAS